MEELTILRLPPRLADKVNEMFAQLSDPSEVGLMDFVKRDEENYYFVFGKEKYHATMCTLPTMIESQKSYDNITYYMNGNVGAMLLVHDVLASEPRPDIDPNLTSGIAPPMQNIVERRFNKLDEGDIFTVDEINAADCALHDLTREYSKRDQSAKLTPVHFEEIVDAEPFMEYWDDITEIEEGDDGFAKGASAAIELAWRAYQADKATWPEAIHTEFNETQAAEAKAKSDAKIAKQNRIKAKKELELKQIRERKEAEKLAHAQAVQAHVLATSKSPVNDITSTHLAAGGGPNQAQSFLPVQSTPGASPPPLPPSPFPAPTPLGQNPAPTAINGSGAVSASASAATQGANGVGRAYPAAGTASVSGSPAPLPPSLPLGTPLPAANTTTDEDMDAEVVQIVGSGSSSAMQSGPSPSPFLAGSRTSELRGTPQARSGSPAFADGQTDPRVNILKAKVAALQSKVELKKKEELQEEAKVTKHSMPHIKKIIQVKVDSLKAEKVVLESQLHEAQTQLNDIYGGRSLTSAP